MRIATCAASAMLLAAWGTACARVREPPNRRPVDRAEVVRCDGEADVSCVAVTLQLTPHEASSFSADSAMPGAWHLSVGKQVVSAEYAMSRVPRGAPTFLMLLVDLSGSMRGQSVQSTRAALRTFLLQELDPRATRVAVAPFAGPELTAGIGVARFASLSEAASVVDALPEPNGNTALYDAIVRGANRLTSQLEGTAGGRGVIMVVTDGRNDPTGRTPPAGRALLDATRRQDVTAAVRNAHAHLEIVGFGSSLDTTDLRLLAEPTGQVTIAGESALALRRAFGEVAAAMRTEREVVFPLLDGNRFGMTRIPRSLTVWRNPASGDTIGPTYRANWRQPLFAPPVYSSVGAGVATLRAPENVALRGTTHGRRLFIVVLLVIAVSAAWMLVPRFVWPHPSLLRVGDDEQGTEAAPAKAIALRSRVTMAHGLRRDLNAAPPRGVDEVTLTGIPKVDVD